MNRSNNFSLGRLGLSIFLPWALVFSLFGATTVSAVVSCQGIFDQVPPYIAIRSMGEARSGEVQRLIQTLHGGKHLFAQGEVIKTPENIPALRQMRHELHRMRNLPQNNRISELVYKGLHREIEALYQEAQRLEAEGAPQKETIELAVKYSVLLSMPLDTLRALNKGRPFSEYQMRRSNEDFQGFVAELEATNKGDPHFARETSQRLNQVITQISSRFAELSESAFRRTQVFVIDLRTERQISPRYRFVLTFEDLSILDFIEARADNYAFLQLPKKVVYEYDGLYGTGFEFLFHDIEHAYSMAPTKLEGYGNPSKIEIQTRSKVLKALNSLGEDKRAPAILALFVLLHERGSKYSAHFRDNPAYSHSRTRDNIVSSIRGGASDAIYSRLLLESTKRDDHQILTNRIEEALNWVETTLEKSAQAARAEQGLR